MTGEPRSSEAAPGRRFAVVGPGRAGRSFAAALAAVGWEATGHHGRRDPVRTLADGNDLVMITVPDDEIAGVAAAIDPGRAAVVHVSGSKGLDVLAGHARRASVHPLMSLPDESVGAQRLRGGGHFAVAGDPIARELVRALGGRPIEIDDGDRALYHAAAAVAANHLVVLCAQVERLAAAAGVPEAAYWDLMAGTLDNVGRIGAVSSLTGPAARGDVSTLVAHLRSLPPEEHALYLTLATHAAALAGRTLPDGLEVAGTDDGDPDRAGD